MFRTIFPYFTFLVAATSGSPTFAHWGHVGELAGHGHAIAIGALIGAAALAAALRKPRTEVDDCEDEQDEELVTEGEVA